MARRTFFSFHYAPDVWRAWNVRNSRVVSQIDKTDEGFFDSSVFEASKKEGDETLKRFLREGMENSSVTCVLAGKSTWTRRWVRYEIVRSVIKGNGLLTVDIHKVKDADGETAEQGANPLDAVGLYRSNGNIYFAEWSEGKWIAYKDYTSAIPEKDLWMAAPATTTVVALSKHCMRYDFAAQNGRENLAGWIETAAKLAGR
jgi:hypothetical protein